MQETGTQKQQKTPAKSWNLPAPFDLEFEQEAMALTWKPAQERRQEKDWPLGPVCGLNSQPESETHNRAAGNQHHDYSSASTSNHLWPCVFLAKRGFYLLAAVALPPSHSHSKNGNASSNAGRRLAVDLPEITAAFAVLEDISSFLAPDLSITDAGAIAELQYKVKCALPFGSPVNSKSAGPTGSKNAKTSSTSGKHQRLSFDSLGLAKQGSSASEPTQRVPAWKPFVVGDSVSRRKRGEQEQGNGATSGCSHNDPHAGSSSGSGRAGGVMLSIVETIHCAMYGAQHEDECFVTGTVYCSATDLPGFPEVSVPLAFPEVSGVSTGSTTESSSPSSCSTTLANSTSSVTSNKGSCGDKTGAPRITVYNCAQLHHERGTTRVSVIPPSTPFVLCRYRFAQLPRAPVRGFYQVKEISPMDVRLLLRLEFSPGLFFDKSDNFGASTGPGSSTRDHNAGGGSSGLSGGSSNKGIMQVRLSFLSRIKKESLQSSCHLTPSGTEDSGEEEQKGGSFSITDSRRVIVWTVRPPKKRNAETSQASSTNYGGTDFCQLARASLIGELSFESPSDRPERSSQGRKHGTQRDGKERLDSFDDFHVGSHAGDHGSASGGREVRDRIVHDHRDTQDQSSFPFSTLRRGGGSGASGRQARPYLESNKGVLASSVQHHDEQHSIRGLYCEVFLKIPGATFSGLKIDPEAISVYPPLPDASISVRREALAGRYIIWNAADEAIKGRTPLDK
ncbi:unnamed protein product [Amoebophrya sp. A25]|nr:unnamed protein product [Amoebophrya sp. A25]|eukprot:GSA25T00023086001.1